MQSPTPMSRKFVCNQGVKSVHLQYYSEPILNTSSALLVYMCNVIGRKVGAGDSWVGISGYNIDAVQCAIKLKSQATFTLYLDGTNIQISLLILCLTFHIKLGKYMICTT